MKRKLLVLVAVVLLISICSLAFTACDQIFTRNEERDAKQIVATVTYTSVYGTQTDYVYKYEAVSSFNNYAYYYVNYYGYTYEDTANYVIKSLAQQKLLRMYAKSKLAEMYGFSSIPADIKIYLSDSEVNKAIEEVNDSLFSSLTSLIEEAITEDNYNNSATEEKETEEEVEVTDPVYVKFDVNGGSTVDRQKIQKGQKAEEPDDPTKDGYTFVGWFKDSDLTQEFDFETEAINEKTTIYAKWAEYTAPRTVKEEAEEDEDADYDPDLDGITISAKFFTTAYYNEKLVEDEIGEEECFEDMEVPTNSTYSATLKSYVDDALSTLKKNLCENLFMDSIDDVYDYYFEEQMESLLVSRLEREIQSSVSVSKEEVEAEFARALNANIETFNASESSYESALTSSLSTTYYHQLTEDGGVVSSYGFVNNILLKMSEEDVQALEDIIVANPANADAVKQLRNKLISNLTVKVSNPKYDAEAVVEDADGNEIELFDPMMDPANPYNNVKGILASGKAETDDTKLDKSFEAEGGNDYNAILTFVYDDNTKKAEIKYNAYEHPAMAYLLEEVPAFDKDGKTGIIHQIYNSLEQVKACVAAGKLTQTQGVYWLRQVASAWLYLVGDDSGAVSSDSNNNGLGYLITPEGKDSSYLGDFTTYARKLIANGTGSYSNGTVTDDLFVGDADAGVLAGDQFVYVVADSFIESASTGGYAGIFVLLNTYTVWDENAYTTESLTGNTPDDRALDAETKVALDSTSQTLPLNYVVTYAEDLEDVQTIYDVIYNSILESKKDEAYNVNVNTMGLEWAQKIEYNEKIIKSIYEDLE